MDAQEQAPPPGETSGGQPLIKIKPTLKPHPFKTQATLCSEIQGPIPWVAEPLFALGSITTLFGASGSFKSMLCYSLAHHLAAGQSWLGYSVKRPWQVAYIDEEVATRLVATRSRALAEGSCLPTSNNLHFASRRGFHGPTLAASLLLAFEIAGLKPNVVFLDTFREVFSTAGGARENDAGAVRAFYKDLRTLTTRGMAIVVIHHAKKVQPEGSTIPLSDMVSGSSDFKAASDNFLALQLVEKGCAKLTFLKTREIIEPPPLWVTIGSEPGLITLTASTVAPIQKGPGRTKTDDRARAEALILANPGTSRSDLWVMAQAIDLPIPKHAFDNAWTQLSITTP